MSNKPMNTEPMRKRIAFALGRKTLSEEEYDALDLPKALNERRAVLKAKKAKKVQGG